MSAGALNLGVQWADDLVLKHDGDDLHPCT